MGVDIDLCGWLITNGTTSFAEKLACVVLADSIKGGLYSNSEIPWESLGEVLGMDTDRVFEVLCKLQACGAATFSYGTFSLTGCSPKTRDISTPATTKKRGVPKRALIEVFARDKFECVYCGAAESLTIDHKMPLSRGGGDEVGNLQVCCKSCNSSKGTKTCEEFTEWKVKKAEVVK